MVGKTQEEVAALTENLYGNYQRLAAQPAPSPSYTPSTHAPTSSPAGPPDPQLFYRDAAEYQRQLIAYQNSQFDARISTLAAPVFANQAETARTLSKNEHADAWRRWEPEIEMELAAFPVHTRTKQMYDTAVKIVRGNHADELADERAQRLIAQGGAGTERALNVGHSTAPAFDKLDEVYDTEHAFFRYAREQRVSKEMIREHCRKMKISVDEYVRNAMLGSVVATPNGFNRSSE